MEKLQNVLRRMKPLGVATKAALIGSINKQKAHEYLITGLGKIPGVPAKMSQLLSMKGDHDLDRGKVLIEPLSIEWVLEQIKEKSPELYGQIHSIDPEAKVASLGQVHKIQALNGIDYAVKIQFPGIQETLIVQVKDFFKIAYKSPAQKWGFDINSYEEKFMATMEEELDYQRELGNQFGFENTFKNSPQILIPKTYPEYSCSQILVQQWEPSVSVQEFSLSALSEQKVKAANALVEFFFRSLLQHHKLHGDLHPQNWGVRKAPIQLVVYDFGSVLTLEPQHVQVLVQLIDGFLNETSVNVFDSLVFLGFDPDKLSPIASRLPILCQKIFEPLLKKDYFNFTNWKLGDHFEKVLGEDKWFFRTAGPAWFFLFIKSLSGVLHGLKVLDVNVHLYRIYESCLRSDLSPVSVPAISGKYVQDDLSSDSLAKFLRVQVFANGVTYVDMKMPYKAVDDLVDLLPESAISYVETHNINIPSIIKKVQRTGYAPQAILEFKQEKHIKIFLE